MQVKSCVGDNGIIKREANFKMPDGKLQIELPEPMPFVVKLGGRRFSNSELFEIDRENEELRIETNAEGFFEIMPHSFLEASRKNMEIIGQMGEWNQINKNGVCFESSAKFSLPNGAKRMADVSWILREKYFALPKIEREERYAEITPDFVIELRSKLEYLPNLENKMCEWIDNGVSLSWLIDPFEKKVHIYRANGEIEILENPAKVSGEDVLDGFELDLAEIF